MKLFNKLKKLGGEIVKKILLQLLLLVVLYAFLVFLYGGIGYGVAWVLDKGLNVDVNYSVFVWVGIVILIIRIVIVVITKHLEKKLSKR